MKIKIYILLLLISLFGVTFIAFAQQQSGLTDYQLLAPIPVGERGELVQKTDAETFIPGLFRLTIMLATGLAVLFIIWGGVQYMSTDAFTGKESAKETIWNAIMGLLLALSAWLIISTINPNLMKFDLSIERFEIKEDTNKPGGSSTAPIPSGGCANCVNLTVPVKNNACAASVCTINADVATKLVALNKQFPLVVTEAYPPTVQHQNTCHAAGTCVDVQRVADNRVYEFIDKANQSGLKAVYEVTSEARKNTLIGASCGTNTACRTTLGERIAVLPGQITAEHFSVYNN